jgi:hypothetical protein
MTASTKEMIDWLERQSKMAIKEKCPKAAGQLDVIAQRLRELDKPDCVWVKLPCGRDSSGKGINSYAPSCITVYTDEPLPMKLSKFCHLCGGAVKDEAGLHNQ